MQQRPYKSQKKCYRICPKFYHKILSNEKVLFVMLLVLLNVGLFAQHTNKTLKKNKNINPKASISSNPIHTFYFLHSTSFSTFNWGCEK